MSFLTQYNTTPFQRKTIVYTKGGGYESSIWPATFRSVNSFGGTFILLSAEISDPTYTDDLRLRLYADADSQLADASRSLGDFEALSQSISLIADIHLTSANRKLTFNPPIIGRSGEFGYVWSSLSGSGGVLGGSYPDGTQVGLDLVVYPLSQLENPTLDRSTLTITASNISPVGNGVSGSIITPKSFLILSGSATTQSRLRLYSRTNFGNPYWIPYTGEQTRSFGTPPTENSHLIADLMFDSGGFHYPLVPVLEAYTWENANTTQTSGGEPVAGTGAVGFILENMSGVTATITASLHVFSTED